MAELQFQQIALKDITPDPNQPRKFYEEHAMNELTQSVKESGVLQPILVRKKPKGKGYLLVCGERRYRASEAAGKNDIPAVIRDLTDEEALQLQIVENLQRKDVHPMEEAVAFKSFIEGKNWSFDEIAKRVGKSEYYVKQRIKLNSLTEDFQKLFFQSKMNIATALVIAQIPESTQTKIFNDNVDDDDLNNPKFEFQMNSYQMNSYKGNLQSATFDLEDAELVPSMGACANCQFNSAFAKLFPDETARCNNISCYKIKSDVGFNKSLDEAKDDPTILFVNTSYGMSSNEEKEIKKLGIDLIGRNDYEVEYKPDYPDMDDFKENLEDGEYETEEEMKEAFNEAIEDYNKDLEQYEKKIASGKFKKAFVIHGNDKGAYIFIALKNKSKSTNSSASTNTTDEVITEDIDSEIERIQDKEKRSKQIDENKLWDVLKPCFDPVAICNKFVDVLSPLERKAAAWALYDKLSWNKRDVFLKRYGYNDKTGITDVSENTLQNMMRFFLLDVLPPSALFQGHNRLSLICMELGNTYIPVEILQAQDDANLKIEKRVSKVEKRIQELQDQKKLLKVKTPKAKK